MKMIKIAVVFTGFDCSLYSVVEQALKNSLPDVEYKLMVFANPNLIAQTFVCRTQASVYKGASCGCAGSNLA